MLADAVSERDRAFCFPVRAFSCQRRMSAQRLRPLSAATLQILQAVAQAGPLVGYGIGYFTLRLYLESYLQFWQIMGLTQLVIVAFVCEFALPSVLTRLLSIRQPSNYACAQRAGRA